MYVFHEESFESLEMYFLYRKMSNENIQIVILTTLVDFIKIKSITYSNCFYNISDENPSPPSNVKCVIKIFKWSFVNYATP